MQTIGAPGTSHCTCHTSHGMGIASRRSNITPAVLRPARITSLSSRFPRGQQQNGLRAVQIDRNTTEIARMQKDGSPHARNSEASIHKEESTMSKMSALTGSLLACSLASGIAQAQEFTVRSSSAVNGRLQQAQFANGFGCTGKNLSPQISWSGAPQGTRSFVVTMFDPDAPTGSGWWHWALANVPASVNELQEGAGNADGKLPAGTVEVRGDSGQAGYFGACPPTGQTHRYVITVHALKVDQLALPTTATPAMLGFMVLGHSLGKATLTIEGAR